MWKTLVLIFLSSRFLTHGNGVTALELDLEQTNLVPGMMK